MTEQQFDTPHPIRLNVKVASGDIHVTAAEGTTSTVALDGSQQLIEATSVELQGDRLVIEQRRKSFRNWFAFGEELRVQVRVPDGSSVELATASGDAVLDGSFADIEMNSASGDFRATGEVAGNVTVKNASGDVQLASVAGDVKVRSVSGDVEAQSVGGALTVQSVSGDVTIGSLREGMANVQSVSGDVELGVASGTRIDVDAVSTSGEISSEIPLADAPGNEGGPLLVIRSKSVSGDFRVRRAA
jgi:DUF4097 and DUF4098 domain-containing protein YvlB